MIILCSDLNNESGCVTALLLGCHGNISIRALFCLPLVGAGNTWWLLCCCGFIDNLDRVLCCFHIPVLDRENNFQCIIQELVLLLQDRFVFYFMFLLLMMLLTSLAVLRCTAKVNSWRSEMDWFLVPTRLEIMRCLSLRRVLTTWKTSTIFSFSALSTRFHRAQKTPEREEPSLREHEGT